VPDTSSAVADQPNLAPNSTGSASTVTDTSSAVADQTNLAPEPTGSGSAETKTDSDLATHLVNSLAGKFAGAQDGDETDSESDNSEDNDEDSSEKVTSTSKEAPPTGLTPVTPISTPDSNKQANAPAASVVAGGTGLVGAFNAIQQSLAYSAVMGKYKGNNDDGETSDDDSE
jgi:hypothetical protein